MLVMDPIALMRELSAATDRFDDPDTVLSALNDVARLSGEALKDPSLPNDVIDEFRPIPGLVAGISWSAGSRDITPVVAEVGQRIASAYGALMVFADAQGLLDEPGDPPR